MSLDHTSRICEKTRQEMGIATIPQYSSQFTEDLSISFLNVQQGTGELWAKTHFINNSTT